MRSRNFRVEFTSEGVSSGGSGDERRVKVEGLIQSRGQYENVGYKEHSEWCWVNLFELTNDLYGGSDPQYRSLSGVE